MFVDLHGGDCLRHRNSFLYEEAMKTLKVFFAIAMLFSAISLTGCSSEEKTTPAETTPAETDGDAATESSEGSGDKE